jgi:hypothetical protein
MFAVAQFQLNVFVSTSDRFQAGPLISEPPGLEIASFF